MMKPKWLAGIATTALIAGLAGLWLYQPADQPVADTEPPAAMATQPLARPEPDRRPASSPVPEAASTATPVAHETPPSLGAEPFADSLQGTGIDGRLAADANGELVLETATRDFFDYFLNTVGEVSPEQALAEIERLARAHLPASAAQQALALLDDYLTYKREAVALGDRSLDPAQARDPAYQLAMFGQALDDLKRLRRDIFSTQAHQAFFGLEEAYGDYTLANLALQQRQDLSPAARDTLMEWHRQQLPAEIRQTEQRLHSEADLHHRRQQAIATAASPVAAGEQLRELGLAEDQVSQVVGYLEERAVFDRQFAAYQAELDRLRAAGLASSDLRARHTALLEQHFDSEQGRTWARLRALEAPAQP